MDTKKTTITKCSKCGLTAVCFYLKPEAGTDYYCSNCFDGEYKNRKKWFIIFIICMVFVLFACLIIAKVILK